MADVIVQQTTKAGGVYHPPGSVLSLPLRSAERLVSRGVAEWVGDPGEPEPVNALGTVASGHIDLAPGTSFVALTMLGDLPGADALRAAGIEFLESVPRDHDALVALDGIGPATARKILAALEA